ncbi:MAG: LCP family protein [Oscillospiraceae bacterium]|nr:LCP family protein [Oscillospiraceae bacterium]
MNNTSHTPSRDGSRRSRPRRTALDRFGAFALILLLIVSLVFFFRLTSSGLLTTAVLVIIAIALIILNIVHAVIQLPLRRNKLGKLIAGTLALILSIGLIWVTTHMGDALNRVGEIFGQQLVENRQVLVVVRADDPAQELADTAGYTYGYVSGWNAGDTEALLRQLREQLGDFPESTSSNPTALVDSLLASQTDAILMADSALSDLEDMEEYADLGEKVRVIYTYTVSRKVEIAAGTAEITEPFIIYCNGIDSRKNDINATGNSDVNILAVVNPKTREILLLNTPRDYYVALHMNGQLDKLTHAGNYGIEESMGTLSDLYGVGIPYYVRLNFFGLVDIVDAIGGVDVESPKEFTTNKMVIPGPDGKLEKKTFTFPAGPVHLSGQEALAFARERYAFAGGDNQRGKNQMTVIKGIIDKITSPALLKNYQKVLNALPNSFLTNITFDQVKALVRAQQKDGTKWHVTSYAVTGTAGSDYCYSWPGMKLYVTRPDPNSVELAKSLIAQVMNGEVPVIPD